MFKNSDGTRDVRHLFLILRDGCLPETCSFKFLFYISTFNLDEAPQCPISMGAAWCCHS